MRRLILPTVVLTATLTALPLLVPRAQAAALEQDGQVWFMATARGAIHGNWKLYLEAQPRIGGDGIRALLLRPALGYQITKSWSLWQGYGWTPTFDPYKNENRIFQQSLLEFPRGDLPFSVINRTRLEERWIEGANGVAVRLRHMLRVVYPLDASGRWALAGYDEPFVNLNDVTSGPAAGFAQNRAFVGINRELLPGVRLEVGYLNQYINAPTGKPNGMSHNALVWLDYLW